MKTVLFRQKEGFTNNFAELYGLFLALKKALDGLNAFSGEERRRCYSIFGDSELVIRWWSSGHVNVTDERTQLLSRKVMLLKAAYEHLGGRVVRISGNENPADLGFHKG